MAHRPGFQAPTVAARAFATLDRLSGGRAAIHVISGGNDPDQRHDGNTLGKDARCARTAAAPPQSGPAAPMSATP